jgi:geranylgeranyl diphosphate synthase type I
VKGSTGKKYLEEHTKKVRPLMYDFVSFEIKKAKELGEVPVKLLESFRNLTQRGKGVRSGLICLGYRACGGKDIEEITKTSIFMEIFHSGILVHDDFMDRDDLRRGFPTLHKEFETVGKNLGVTMPLDHYGNSVAVCLGDVAFYLSWKILINSNFPKDFISEAANIYCDHIVRVGLGQALDLTVTDVSKRNEKDLLNVLLTKSVEYTSSAPLLIGVALAGETNKEKLRALENYAKCFGWAFQIQDDLLGMFGTEEELGKPIGSDLREGKNTLLMLYLSKMGTEKHLKIQKELMGKENVTDEDVMKVRKTLKESGAYDYVRNMGLKYLKEGRTYIPIITKDENLQEIFDSLITYVMERTK